MRLHAPPGTRFQGRAEIVAGEGLCPALVGAADDGQAAGRDVGLFCGGNLGLVQQRRVVLGVQRYQALDHLGLGVDPHPAAAGQGREVDAVRAAVEAQLDAVVDQALAAARPGRRRRCRWWYSSVRRCPSAAGSPCMERDAARAGSARRGVGRACGQGTQPRGSRSGAGAGAPCSFAPSACQCAVRGISARS